MADVTPSRPIVEMRGIEKAFGAKLKKAT